MLRRDRHWRCGAPGAGGGRGWSAWSLSGCAGSRCRPAGVASQVLPRRFSVSPAAQDRGLGGRAALAGAARIGHLPGHGGLPAVRHRPVQQPEPAADGAPPRRQHPGHLPERDQPDGGPGAGPVPAARRCCGPPTPTPRAAWSLPSGWPCCRAARQASTAEGELGLAGQGAPPDSVRPAAVPGTLASRFDDRQRQVNVNSRSGPYLILATVGYANARPRVDMTDDPYLRVEMTSLAQGLESAVTSCPRAAAAGAELPGSARMLSGSSLTGRRVLAPGGRGRRRPGRRLDPDRASAAPRRPGPTASAAPRCGC